MSIQEWGAIGELIGGLAVILTLIYLARQIKAQNKEARLSATRDLARDWAEMLRFISGDDQHFELYTKALQDYANLSDGERIKAYMMLSQAMRLLEIQYFHLSEGNFEPQLFVVMEYRVKELSAIPGVQQFWARNKEQYNSDFIKYVDTAIQRHSP